MGNSFILIHGQYVAIQRCSDTQPDQIGKKEINDSLERFLIAKKDIGDEQRQA